MGLLAFKYMLTYVATLFTLKADSSSYSLCLKSGSEGVEAVTIMHFRHLLYQGVLIRLFHWWDVSLFRGVPLGLTLSECQLPTSRDI